MTLPGGPASQPEMWRRGPGFVAVGGGHGLSATLSALRRLGADLTAIVGVADDGGSSGRLRAELGIAPPGDLRMALAALCGDDPISRTWSRVLQHRFAGEGDLAGHAVGNLLIAALWEQTGDMVVGLDYLGGLVGARGRVLPATATPMDLVADVAGVGGVGTTEIHGQAMVARSGGRVTGLRLLPADAEACPQAVAAIRGADYVVIGPGSWFTSVLPHFELAGLRAALAATRAVRVLVLNLESETAETVGFRPETHLTDLAERYPEVAVDVVLADDRCVPDQAALAAAAEAVGAQVRYERLAPPAYGSQAPTPQHSADLLAAAFTALVERGRITPWR